MIRRRRPTNAQTNLPAQKATPGPSARLPLTFTHFRRSRRVASPALQGPAPALRLANRPLAALNAAGPFQSMQRQHRLGAAGRISEIHRRGRSAANGLLVMRVLPNGLDRSRFCFVTGKRVGNAVVRNRVKRRLREVVRNSTTASGWDTVLIARKGAGEADFRQLEKAVHNLIRRTKLSTSPVVSETAHDPRDTSK